MQHLGLARFEAGWYTPAVTMIRLQRAYLENAGEEQRWSKSRLDQIMELEGNGK